MPAGVPPKPTKLKLLQGNPGHRPIKPDDFEPDVDAPEMPDFVERDPEARIEWNRVMDALVEQGLMSTFDLAAFASYCKAWSLLVRCERWIVDNPDKIMEVATNGISCASSWVRLRAETQKEVRQWAAEFGFTPAQRSRVSKLPSGKPKTKKKEGWGAL